MLTTIGLVSLGGLLAVWVLYPLAVAALAGLRRSPESRNYGTPSVSVIIATADGDDAIRARVANVLASTYEPRRLEVVVATDARRTAGSSAELEFSGERVTMVSGDEPGGKAATLNAAVRASRGQLLVFADTHQRFEPNAVERLVRAMRDETTGAASGSLVLPDGPGAGTLYQRYWGMERRLRRDEARLHSAIGVTGAIYILRRCLWTPLPPGLLLDDLFTPMCVVLRGYRVGFVEDARAFETRRAAAGREYRRKVRTLTGVVQLCLWLPRVLVPVRNPVWLQFVVHKLLRLLTPYWALAVALWLGAAFVAWGRTRPAVAAVLLVVAGAGLAWSSLAQARRARALREAIVSGVLLQAAVVMGTVNGLRGRWDVWRR